MLTLSTILHPTDCTDSAARALEVAARLATTHGATLVILHAEVVHGPSSSEMEAGLDEYVASARRLVGSLADGSSTAAQVPVEVVEARTFFAHDAITEVAADRHADLIVMGTHGRRGLNRLLLGSNAERVLRQASCHVLTVRADAAVPDGVEFRELLVPVDFSDASRRGLDGALALARNGRARIHVVHAMEPLPPWARYELGGDPRERVEERLRAWVGEAPGVHYHVTKGHAAAEIARVADDLNVDLIVMSSRGATVADWLLVGTVTERVCRMAGVPVLTMRQQRSGGASGSGA